MKVWTSRDKNGGTIKMWDSDNGRVLNRGGYYFQNTATRLNPNSGKIICKEVAVKLLGRMPRKGSCKQMELTLTEIE